MLSLIITAFCPTDCHLGCTAKSQRVGPRPLSQAAGRRERGVQTRGPCHLHIPRHRARRSLEHKWCASSPCSQSEDMGILRGERHAQVSTDKGRAIQVFWLLGSFPLGALCTDHAPKLWSAQWFQKRLYWHHGSQIQRTVKLAYKVGFIRVKCSAWRTCDNKCIQQMFLQYCHIIQM